MTEYFDALEMRTPQDRETGLFNTLQKFLPKVAAAAPGWAKHFKGHDIATIDYREKLAQLPVLRKSELIELQQQEKPFGGFTMGPVENLGRVLMSPGPIFEPMGNGPDPWRSARALFAAGFRKGDIVHNAFSYHLTPGGFILDSGARALGCAVLPAGTGNTEAQLDAIEQFEPVAFTGTPDYLKILLDKASELGRNASSIKRALVSGGALFPSLRQEYADRGVAVLQCYATADVGSIAYESDAMEGMIIDEGVIVEIVRPGTGDPVSTGEVGEVVVTNFNPVYPMIRFGTGDLSAILPGTSPCGRTNIRIKGWMGRADQTTKVKGMFIHTSQIAEVAKRHPGLGRMQLQVHRENEQDVVVLKVEASAHSDDLRAAIAQSFQAVCKLRGDIKLILPESLANDGKVIDDQRSYD